MPGPFYPLTHRDTDWKLPLPFPYHFSFLSLLENSRGRQLRGRKNHYLDQGQELDGSFKISGISWPECFSRPFRKCIPARLLLSVFQPWFPERPGWVGYALRMCFLSACASPDWSLRKKLVEISKTQWMCTFKCRVPFWHQTRYFSLFR